MKPNEFIKINKTDNYGMFLLNEKNRPVDQKEYEYRVVFSSISENGFLPCYPIWAVQYGNKLLIFDGHRRFHIAKTLNVPLWYIIVNPPRGLEPKDTGNWSKPWVTKHYVLTYAQVNNPHYKKLLEFSETYRLPIGIAAGILEGNMGASGQTGKRIKDGKFIILDEETAIRIASVTSALREIGNVTRSSGFLSALSRCMRVDNFDIQRFIINAQKCPGMIVQQPTIESWLSVMEEIYNRNSRNPIALSFNARQAFVKHDKRVRSDQYIKERKILRERKIA
jgi:hypothetical protein